LFAYFKDRSVAQDNQEFLKAAAAGDFDKLTSCTVELDDIKKQAFLLAAYFGHFRFLDYFIQKGFTPDFKIEFPLNYRVTSPLHVACENNQISVCRLLLRNGALIESTDTMDWTPLHSASRGNATEAISLLLACGAAIEAKARYNDAISGCTPLFIAAEYGSYDAMKLLLEKGANKSTKASFGLTPAHAICQVSGYHKSYRKIPTTWIDPPVSRREIETWITDVQIVRPKASYPNRVKILECLMEKGFDMIASDDFGFQPLHLACIHQFGSIVSFLLKTSSPNTQTKHGWTPLHLIALQQSDEAEVIAKSLIIHGANLEAPLASYPNNANPLVSLTPLGVSIMTGSLSLAKILLESGSSTRMPGSRRYTILHMAVRVSRTEALRLFSTKTASKGTLPSHADANTDRITGLYTQESLLDINVLDNRKKTPLLHYFSLSRFPDRTPLHEVVEQLLELGADITARDSFGHGVLHNYFRSSVKLRLPDIPILLYLVKSGAPLENRDSNGLTPLLFAISSQEPAVVRLLIENGANIYAKAKNRRDAWAILAKRPIPKNRGRVRRLSELKDGDDDGKSEIEHLLNEADKEMKRKRKQKSGFLAGLVKRGARSSSFSK
jgi:ankyrin repeat protein